MFFSGKRHIIASVILLLSIVFLAIFFKDDFLEHLLTIDYRWFFTGIIVFLGNYIFRAYRLLIIVNHHKIRYFIALRTVSIHGFLTYLLPFKTGELSLPLLLSRQGIPISSSVQSLIKFRLLDLSCLGFLLFVSLLISDSSMDNTVKIIFFIISILLIFSSHALKIIWIIIPEKVRNWANRHDINIKGTIHFDKTEWLLSLGIWVSVALSFYCIVKSLNMNLTVSDTMCLVAIQLPLQLIPLQGIANTGNHEAGWLAGLALFGISPAESLSFALSSHVLLSGYVLLLGTVASILIVLSPQLETNVK